MPGQARGLSGGRPICPGFPFPHPTSAATSRRSPNPRLPPSPPPLLPPSCTHPAPSCPLPLPPDAAPPPLVVHSIQAGRRRPPPLFLWAPPSSTLPSSPLPSSATTRLCLLFNAGRRRPASALSPDGCF